jgi:hypothetical protein
MGHLDNMLGEMLCKLASLKGTHPFMSRTALLQMFESLPSSMANYPPMHVTSYSSSIVKIFTLYTHIFFSADVFVHITHSCTPSRPFWEVKLGRVESVVRCVSTCEASMTNASPFCATCNRSWCRQCHLRRVTAIRMHLSANDSISVQIYAPYTYTLCSSYSYFRIWPCKILIYTSQKLTTQACLQCHMLLAVSSRPPEVRESTERPEELRGRAL